MAGIYGDMLIYYSEQFQTFEAFYQVARVGSGYDKVGDSFDITGIIQTGNGANIVGNAGRLSQYANWKTLAVSDEKQLWTYQQQKFGTYVRYEDVIYVIGKRLDWSKEAGFYAYKLDKIIGDNGNQNDTLDIKEGVF